MAARRPRAKRGGPSVTTAPRGRRANPVDDTEAVDMIRWESTVPDPNNPAHRIKVGPRTDRLIQWLIDNTNERLRLFSDNLDNARSENRDMIVGKEGKSAYYQRIAAFVFDHPDEEPSTRASYLANPSKYVKSVDNRLLHLRTKYKEMRKKLHSTGFGLQYNSLESEELPSNIIATISMAYPWYHSLHGIWESLPNLNPTVVTSDFRQSLDQETQQVFNHRLHLTSSNNEFSTSNHEGDADATNGDGNGRFTHYREPVFTGIEMDTCEGEDVFTGDFDAFGGENIEGFSGDVDDNIINWGDGDLGGFSDTAQGAFELEGLFNDDLSSSFPSIFSNSHGPSTPSTPLTGDSNLSSPSSRLYQPYPPPTTSSLSGSSASPRFHDLHMSTSSSAADSSAGPQGPLRTSSRHSSQGRTSRSRGKSATPAGPNLLDVVGGLTNRLDQHQVQKNNLAVLAMKLKYERDIAKVKASVKKEELRLETAQVELEKEQLAFKRVQLQKEMLDLEKGGPM